MLKSPTIPQKATSIYCKSFEVESSVAIEMNCNLLENSQLHSNLVWSNCIAQDIIAISLEKFHGYQSICENCETFSP